MNTFTIALNLVSFQETYIFVFQFATFSILTRYKKFPISN